jgi:septum formation protein
MNIDNINNYKVILASKSPRRQHMLNDLGLNFEVRTKETEETYPSDMDVEQIPIYLAEQKALAFKDEIKDNELIITADTIVTINGEVLGKPKDREHAKEMLYKLSGKGHRVISGVSLYSKDKLVSFNSITEVFFKTLTEDEISYYLDTYKPYDKAGAYGIQEWIGYIGVVRIEGSYFNVVGLPIQQLYKHLAEF